MYEHLRNSTPGLLIYYQRQREHTSFLTMRRGKIEISKFSNYGFKHKLFTSCNGLLLECDQEKDHSPYIANPSTNQQSALPHKYCSGIAYAPASMVYKVVNPCYYKGGDPKDLYCLISAVGVDKSWRYLRDQSHLSLAARKGLAYLPLITEGFVHWTMRKSDLVLTLNVETEAITVIPVPRGYGGKFKHYLSTGSSLTFLTHIDEYLWEVWELRQETGEWMKLPKIDLDPQILKFEYLKRRARDPSPVPPNCSDATVEPVGWLNGRQVLVLHAFPTRLYFVYDILTRDIDFFELDPDFDSYKFTVHRNSLVGFGEF